FGLPKERHPRPVGAVCLSERGGLLGGGIELPQDLEHEAPRVGLCQRRARLWPPRLAASLHPGYYHRDTENTEGTESTDANVKPSFRPLPARSVPSVSLCLCGKYRSGAAAHLRHPPAQADQQEAPVVEELRG